MKLLQGGIQHSCLTFYTQLTQNKYKPDGKVMKGKHAVDQDDDQHQKIQGIMPWKKKTHNKKKWIGPVRTCRGPVTSTPG